MKDNVLKMSDMMGKWKTPLFERKTKTMTPEDLESAHSAAVMARLDEIKSHGKDIQKFVKDTTEAIKPDKKSQQWLAYVDYLNSLVIDGITTGINASLEYLAAQISIKHNRLHGNSPMFDIKLDLDENNVCFEPSIECNSRENGIRDILQKIVDDFISLAVLVPRLDGS
jgi:dynein heavy chain